MLGLDSAPGASVRGGGRVSEYIVEAFGIVQDFANLHGDMTTPLYEAIMDVIVSRQREEIVRCKDCVHFTPYEEFYIDLGGLVVPGATSDTCDLWAGTKCKTLPEGFCYLGERKVVD